MKKTETAKVAAGFESGQLFRTAFSPLWKMFHSITKASDTTRPMLSKILVERETVEVHRADDGEGAVTVTATTQEIMRAVATDTHRMMVATFTTGQDDPIALLPAGCYEFVCAPGPSAGVLLRTHEVKEGGPQYPNYRRLIGEKDADWGDILGTYEASRDYTNRPSHNLKLRSIGEGFGMNMLYLPTLFDMDSHAESKDGRIKYVCGWTIQQKAKDHPFRFVGAYKGVRIEYIVMPLSHI